MDVIERRERERVIKEAKDWVASIKGVYSAFLIGSYSRGDFNEGSDVDVLLIGEFNEENPVKRLFAIGSPPGYEVIPLTEREFFEKSRKNNPIIWDIKERGVVLKDDLNLCKRAQLNCVELRSYLVIYSHYPISVVSE
ncbi:nucleotidyltransferase domain-containing protein [Acidianus sp. RZ1]|uniref:nucleotidyltransferase domain-containing protein n=1 Tax=Acidianus sp. RZ1 TaxID=1540082 RepID=UPI001491E9BD|nr:nucleotidyltransferase domain-containing protein [Acidianus sp. RZ1]NON62113.1 nucleotidyltransferase domain-containing protein [Acidianus sp. RZ1]